MGAARCYASTAAATGRSGRVMRWASSPCRATQCTVATLTTMHIAAVVYQIQRRHQRRGTLEACLLSVAKVVAHLQRGRLHTGAICSTDTSAPPRSSQRAPPLFLFVECGKDEAAGCGRARVAGNSTASQKSRAPNPLHPQPWPQEQPATRDGRHPRRTIGGEALGRTFRIAQ
jgi:hypothetical protein